MENNKENSLENILKIIEDIKKQVNETMKVAKNGEKKTLQEIIKLSQEIENASSGVMAVAKTVDELTEGTEKIATIIKTIEDISAKTNLLALNAAIEMSQMKKEAEAKRRFELTRKSTVAFPVFDVSESFKEDMAELKRKRLESLKQTVLSFVNGSLTSYQLDYMETEGKTPSYIAFLFDIDAISGDYMNDYSGLYPHELDDEVSEWIFRGVNLYDEKMEKMQSDFYILYNGEYKHINYVLKNQIENSILKSGNKELFTVEELKEAMGEDKITLN